EFQNQVFAVAFLARSGTSPSDLTTLQFDKLGNAVLVMHNKITLFKRERGHGISTLTCQSTTLASLCRSVLTSRKVQFCDDRESLRLPCKDGATAGSSHLPRDRFEFGNYSNQRCRVALFRNQFG